jgi:hypothetical protein
MNPISEADGCSDAQEHTLLSLTGMLLDLNLSALNLANALEGYSNTKIPKRRNEQK